MGQVALGFRSLLLRSLVFFIMAALLAWALGGQLWPSPVQADLKLIEAHGQSWAWRARLDPDVNAPSLSFQLVHGSGSQPRTPFVPTQDVWDSVLPLKTHAGTLLAAGRHARSGQWVMLRIDAAGKISHRSEFADRLALVEAWTTPEPE